MSNWRSYGLVSVETTVFALFREANGMTSLWKWISGDGSMPYPLVDLDAWRSGQNRVYATEFHHVACSGIIDTYPNRPEISSGRRVASYSSLNP